MRAKFKKRTGAPDHSKDECSWCGREVAVTVDTVDGEVCRSCYTKHYRLCKFCNASSLHNNHHNTHTIDTGCSLCIGG